MLFIAVILSGLIQWAYWICLYARLIFYKENTTEDFVPVSIVISIKNEAKNLPGLVRFLQNQDYPVYEILFVDDFSSDESFSFLEKQKGIKVIKAKKDLPGKKHALEEGIRRASYDYILVTDGDCIGRSSQWIKEMTLVKKDRQVVLAYAPLTGTSIVGFFAAFEAWIIAIQYLSYACAGMPYMGVGRNMLFDRGLFYKKGGYGGHKDLASGDDDLLIRDISDRTNTTITLNPETKMFSEAPESIMALIRQKKRHLSTSGRYKVIHKILLGLWAFSQMFFYPLLIIYGWITGKWLWSGTIWFIKIVIPWLISVLIGEKMEERRFLKLFPFLDLILAIYYWMMGPFTLIKNKDRWN